MTAGAGRLTVSDVPIGVPPVRNDATQLPPVADAVPRARHFVRSTIGGWGRDQYEEAASLLVSELVTNAVLHARTEVSVSLVDYGDQLVLLVGDGSPVLPVQRRHSREAATGRGLLLLDRYSVSYGVVRSPSGKQVWAVLRPDEAVVFDEAELGAWFEGIEAL